MEPPDKAATLGFLPSALCRSYPMAPLRVCREAEAETEVIGERRLPGTPYKLSEMREVMQYGVQSLPLGNACIHFITYENFSREHPEKDGLV